MRTAAALLRALISLAVLLALLGGLPMLLWWATALVGPPGLAALSNLLTTDDSGQVFLLLLAIAGWVGWACFACAVLLEIPAQLRGRAAPPIRGMVGQRAAAALVGAVLLALPAGTALASPASAVPSPTPPVSVSAAPLPGSDTTSRTSATGEEATAEDGGSAAGRYTVRDVRPAESLWSIAESVLGDGERWIEIAAVNTGRTMTDGSIFHPDQPIQPGWILALPAHTAAAPTATTQDEAGLNTGTGPSEYTVQEGDSLSGIANAELGDAARYQEIFDLNKGEPLPGGEAAFSDPDLIYPGQHLTLPSAGATPRPAPTTPAPEPGTSTPTPDPGPITPPAATPPDTRPTGPSPAPSAPKASPAPTTTQTPPPPAPTTAPSAQVPKQSAPAPAATSPSPASTVTTPSAQRAESGLNWALVAGVGTLLAASLAGALGVRRILQQRQRRAGETIAQEEPTDLEQLLTATSEPAGIDLLNRVLRTLAHQAAADDSGLPSVRGARLGADGITLLLDEPAAPISPFTNGPDARSWILDTQAPLPTTKELQDVQAPYPGLVTLGTEGQGLLLADLTTCGVLLLDGTPDEVLEVARALALELGTCTWTDYSEILTEGLGSRLSGLLPQGRIRTMPHLPAVAADLGELMLEAHQSGEQVLPWLLIGAGAHDQEHIVQLADALAAARNLQTAVVLPATPATRRAFPQAVVLDTTRDQDAHHDLLDLSVTLQRVTDEQYRQYVYALHVSVQDPTPATGAWGFAESHEQSAGTRQPLAVHITSEDAQDPGNPFPALLAGLAPAPAPALKFPPLADDTQDAASGTETPLRVVDHHTGPAPTPTAQPPAEAASGRESTRVRIEMLGPLRISGPLHCAHAPRTTALAALLHLRPGRSADYVCQAMDPINPWSTRTLHSRLSELRSVIGLADDGGPLLPRPKTGAGYTFHPSVTSDWEEFKTLASRGLAAGPKTGTADLEAAMALVRGKPFDGRTLPWADPVIQEILSRITDTAHTLARWHADTQTPDLDAARHAVHTGLEAEETSEVLYRDLLTIEWAAGNDAAVRKTIARLQQMARTYDITLDDATEAAIHHVLTHTTTSHTPPVRA